MHTELRHLFKLYIDECRYTKRLRPETIRGYSEVFNAFQSIMPELVNISDVSPEMITVFFKRLETRERTVGKSEKRTGVKASTIKTYGSKLKSFFDWLVSRGKLDKSPINHTQLPKTQYNDYRALKRIEVQKILTAIMSHAVNPLMLRRDLAIVYVFIFCGLRRNELLSLMVSDVDPDKRLLTVRAETSKSKRERLIPIHPTLWLHLNQYLDERKRQKKKCPFLWIAYGSDARFTAHGLKHWVKRLVRLSGVKFHVHRFRHTFATNLGYSGASLVKIQKLMGHAQISMTMSYLRSIKSEHLDQEISRLSIEQLM